MQDHSKVSNLHLQIGSPTWAKMVFQVFNWCNVFSFCEELTNIITFNDGQNLGVEMLNNDEFNCIKKLIIGLKDEDLFN